MPDELLGSFFDDLGLHKGSEGGHDAEEEMAATSVGSAQEERIKLLICLKCLEQNTHTL